jgi:hypothetical protein
MFHGLAVALFLTAALVLVAGALWALLASARSAHGFGHAVQHPLEQYAGANRFMFSTANSPSAVQEGWSLIDRTSRARRAVRLAVR